MKLAPKFTASHSIVHIICNMSGVILSCSLFQVHFENDARGKYLELLGYKKEELALKVDMLHLII